MSRSKLIIVAGALVALLPVLGFPRLWEAIFQVIIGLSIIGLSLWTTIDRKLSLKAKARDRALNRRSTDFYPKTGQSGRRLTDLQGNLITEEDITPPTNTEI